MGRLKTGGETAGAAAHLAGSSHGDDALGAAARAADAKLLWDGGSGHRRGAAEVGEAGEVGGREGRRRRGHSQFRCCGWWGRMERRRGEARDWQLSRVPCSRGGNMMRAAAATGQREDFFSFLILF